VERTLDLISLNTDERIETNSSANLHYKNQCHGDGSRFVFMISKAAPPSAIGGLSPCHVIEF
jgi:hypothetical protein